MQEEVELIEKEEDMDEDGNQSLTAHPKRKNKKEEHSCKNKRF